MTEPAGPDSPADVTREHVRERYAQLATRGGCCSPSTGAGSCGTGTGCCGGDGGVSPTLSRGYSPEQLASLPGDADLGLGCGNPTALLELAPGEIVLDLGSGAGIDCFLAARRVGPNGRVIGVDRTPEMVAKARANARVGGLTNVEFRVGEIEHLPVADASVDVVISNCAINLVPDKAAVYREAFRVLRPGGRFAVSDLVATRPISAAERADPSLWSSCVSGALEVDEVRRLLGLVGFASVSLDRKGGAAPGAPRVYAAAPPVVPADICARKPAV